MAEKTKTEAPNVSLNDLVSALQAIQPKKEVDYFEYLQRPENRDPAERLTRPVFQHGIPVNLHGVSDDTIKHLNEMQPGIYFDGIVTVELNGKPPHEALYIEYDIKNRDIRFKNHTLFTSLSDLAKKCNEQHKEQVARERTRLRELTAEDK